MRIVITGAGGFLGRRLTQALRHDPAVDALFLVEQQPSFQADAPALTVCRGNFGATAVLDRLHAFAPDAIVHLAAVTTGLAEADFELGMRVNIGGTTGLLDVCRALGRRTRFVLASTIAVHGPQPGQVVDERSFVGADSAYGIQKIILEQMVNEYTRRGFVDGLSLRLPSILVRDERPPQALSGFLSDMIDLPLRGRPFDVPVRPGISVAIASAATATQWLAHALQVPLPATLLQRQVQMPAVSTRLDDLAAAVTRVGSAHGLDIGAIGWRPDADLEGTVSGWAARLRFELARELGFGVDASADAIVESARDAITSSTAPAH